jgi:hypothetical protein
VKKSLALFITILIFDSCIDRLDIIAPDSNSQLVVDGHITDAPGPYTIKLSRTRKLVDFSPLATVSAKRVTIFDNVGNSEVLTEIDASVYQTSLNGIRGVIGREYFVRIETRDDKVYESIPEKINPPGMVDSVYYEFEQYKTEQGIDKYQFRIFMDSKGEPEGENLFLWKLTGTYKVITSPDLHILLLQGPSIKRDPRPCSGAIIDGVTGELIYPNPCECCQCWVNQVDVIPSVSDNYLMASGQFKKVDMGIIPVEFWYFWDKTLVTVEQLSLSKIAFNYWKTVQDQKEGATSLFQPATGKALSNIFLKNGNEEAQGIFYASAISKKMVFLDATKIPLGVGVVPLAPALPPRYNPKPDHPPEYIALWYTPTSVVRESCLIAFRNSSTKQPPDWK